MSNVSTMPLLVPIGTDIPVLERARETGAARILLDAAQKLRDKEDKALHEHPQDNPLDIRKDLKYRLGIIEGIDRVLALPADAGAFIKKATKPEGRRASERDPNTQEASS